MSGVKVTNERPARPIPAVESVAGDVDDENVDWEPGTTTGIPPGTDPGDVLTWDGDSWEPEPASGGVIVQDEGTPLATTGTTLNFVGAAVAATGAGATKTVTVSEPAAAAHVADTSDAHDASAISIVDVGTYFTGTDVEAALQELGAAGGSIPAHTYELANEGGDPLGNPIGNLGATPTIDPSLGNVHTGTVNANAVVTLGAPSGTFARIELDFTNDGTPGRTLSFAGTVTQTGTRDTSAGVTNRAIASTNNGGTSWIVDWLGASVVAALDDLTDVTITSPATGDRLRYNGSLWVNANLHDEPMIASDGSVQTDGLLNPQMHEVAW